MDSLASDRAAHPDRADALELRTEGEPYRRKLRWIEARLEATHDAFVQARATAAPVPRAFGYALAEELLEELGVLERSLAANAGEHAGLRMVRALTRQVQVFGFHLARLDMRVPAAWVRGAARMMPALDSPGMQAMEAIATMHARTTPASAESFILSMTHGHQDLLDAPHLAGRPGS